MQVVKRQCKMDFFRNLSMPLIGKRTSQRVSKINVKEVTFNNISCQKLIAKWKKTWSIKISETIMFSSSVNLHGTVTTIGKGSFQNISFQKLLIFHYHWNNNQVAHFKRQCWFAYMQTLPCHALFHVLSPARSTHVWHVLSASGGEYAVHCAWILVVSFTNRWDILIVQSSA